MSENNFIRVEKSEGKKKNISLKNIEPMNGIKVIKDSSSDLSSDDSSVISDISYQKPKKTKKVLRRKEMPYQQRPQEHDYSAFSNPKKVAPSVKNDYSESESSYQSSEEDNGSEHSFKKSKESWEDKQKMKQDLLMKIQSLEKKGFEFSKKFTMTSNYEEMMFEYQKIKHFVETQSAIKFSRRCLMACVTGLEFVNKRFDPFHIKLEGWSESVMENIDDYDNIFEKLHEKYGGKAEIAPEIELLLTLGGSAFMFHLTNTLLKGPGMGGMLAQNNPNMMQSMMSAMSQGMKDMKPPSGPQMANMFQNQQNPQQMGQNGFPKPMDTRPPGRQEMRGPNIDPGLFNGTPLATNHPSANIQKPMNPQPPPNLFYDNSPIKEDDRFSIASSDSSLSEISNLSEVKSVTVRKNKNGKNGKGGGLELNII